MNYRKKTFIGLSWLTAFRGISRGIVFVKLAVTARILSPQEFGIFGVASLILSLLEVLTETGINIILIQAKGKIERYIDAAWIISIARGLLIGFAIIILSPFIAKFFNISDSYRVLMLISLIPIIRGFINPYSVHLQKELHFKKEFWYRMCVFFIDAATSTVLVVVMGSVFGLILGGIAGVIAELILSFVLFDKRPTFKFQKKIIVSILHHSKWMNAYTIFNYLGQEADDIFVGKLLGSQALGLYQMAFKISLLPISEISDVVSKVIFPIFTKISDKKDRLFRAYIKTTSLTFLVATLMGIIIFVFSKEIVLLVLGNKWLSAVDVLQILSIYGVLRTVSGPTSALFLALGRQDYVATITFIRLSALLITIFPAITLFGLVGAGYSILSSVIIELPVLLFLLYKIFSKKIK